MFVYGLSCSLFCDGLVSSLFYLLCFFVSFTLHRNLILRITTVPLFSPDSHS